MENDNNNNTPTHILIKQLSEELWKDSKPLDGEALIALNKVFKKECQKSIPFMWGMSEEEIEDFLKDNKDIDV